METGEIVGLLGGITGFFGGLTGILSYRYMRKRDRVDLLVNPMIKPHDGVSGVGRWSNITTPKKNDALDFSVEVVNRGFGPVLVAEIYLETWLGRKIKIDNWDQYDPKIYLDDDTVVYSFPRRLDRQEYLRWEPSKLIHNHTKVHNVVVRTITGETFRGRNKDLKRFLSYLSK